MCLTISKLSNRVVLKCEKDLRKYDGILQTPYQHTVIPYSGWLIPSTKGTISKLEDYDIDWDESEYQRIHGGFIHAYKACGYPMLYEAYAIKVMAFGNAGDLICRALYIPKADKNAKRRKANVEFLESKPTLKQIIEKFPFLKEKV